MLVPCLVCDAPVVVKCVIGATAAATEGRGLTVASVEVLDWYSGYHESGSFVPVSDHYGVLISLQV